MNLAMQNFTNMPNTSSICKLNAFEKRIFVPNENYRIVAFIVCASICILGIVGNILFFFGTSKDQARFHNISVKILAITDALCLFAVFNYSIIYNIDMYGYSTTFGCMYSAFVWVYITQPLLNITYVVTVWIGVLVGLNRYIVVCYPLFAKRFSRTAINKKVVCLIITSSFIYNCCLAIFSAVKPINQPNNTTCYYHVSPLNKLYLNSLVIAFDGQIVGFLVPFIILLFVTVRMI